MKLNKLATAMAASSIALSASVVAGSGTETQPGPIQSPFSDTKWNGEVYSHINRTESETTSGGLKSETTDTSYDLDIVRLGVTTQLKDIAEFGVEVEHNLNGGPGASVSTVVNDLYLAKTKGDWVISLGRFKQIVDREDAIEIGDRLFTNYSSAALGSDRRIDGIEAKYANDAGVHGTASIHKGGTEFDGTTGDTSTEDQTSYSASIGLLTNNNGLVLGGTLSYFNDEEGKTKNGAGVTTSDTSDMGYAFNGIIQTGPFTGSLTYSDYERENKTSNFEETSDGFAVKGAIDLGGAARSFDPYGVLQGPSRSRGEDCGHEVVFFYGNGDFEEKNGGIVDPTSSGDGTAWGIGYNGYMGKFSKVSVSLTNSEGESDSNVDTDIMSFEIGYRLDFQ